MEVIPHLGLFFAQFGLPKGFMVLNSVPEVKCFFFFLPLQLRIIRLCLWPDNNT